MEDPTGHVTEAFLGTDDEDVEEGSIEAVYDALRKQDINAAGAQQQQHVHQGPPPWRHSLRRQHDAYSCGQWLLNEGSIAALRH